MKKLDTTLNNTYRKLTGYLKPTKVEEMYHLAGIGSPNQGRSNTCLKERMKQATDNRHMLYGYLPPHRRHVSRHSFLDSVPPPEQIPPPPAKPIIRTHQRTKPEVARVEMPKSNADENGAV